MRRGIGDLESELAELEVALADPETASDLARLRRLAKRHKELEALASASRALRLAEDDVVCAAQLLDEASPAERSAARAELEAAEQRRRAAEERLAELLQPTDPNDGRDVILEIRGAEGGEEANLFARDLFAMYQRWAARRGWTFTVLSLQSSPQGGIDEAIVEVSGEDAWRRLHLEAGPHRVQRVPQTESQGRIHTSSATVSALPEAEEVEVELDPSELRVDVFRSTGPGGQSVNTTDSAVRITHLPTGLVVSMQDEKSQIQNRARALTVLRARLAERARQEQHAAQSAERRSQLGGGGRSEKVRTYNFRENRVTDHRIGLTLHKLDRILAGDLDELSDALVADERARELALGAEGVGVSLPERPVVVER